MEVRRETENFVLDNGIFVWDTILFQHSVHKMFSGGRLPFASIVLRDQAKKGRK